jgi:glucosamine--fructose-6-phosphate aminotransferase (isomerizing)
MCGIVGFSGSSDAITPVIEGLSRLEYRGYDSAGISVKLNNELKIYKKEGKLENLKSLLNIERPSSTIAIGHTRWATHGKVNDTNAHPHGNEKIAVVHNGIIENAYELKKELATQGMEFKSETDSEVFMVLLSKVMQDTSDFSEAIRLTFQKIKGNSAFVIMNKDDHQIYAIKRSAPLVCGLNDNGEVFLSSDPYALVGFATKIFFPEDEVLCVGDYKAVGNKIKFYELDGSESHRYKIQEKQVQLDVASKGKFEHFMLKEIHEQPSLIEKLTELYLAGDGLEQLKELASFVPKNIHLAACGTALHAGLVIKNFFEKYNKIRVLSDYASEFRYKPLVLRDDELGLFISQSGETADTLACQELCANEGLKTYSIVNVEGSTLFRNCDENLMIHAGVEIGVASTKAFTQQVLTGYLLSKAISSDLKDVNECEKIKTEFLTLSSRVSEILTRTDEIKKIAQEIYQHNGFIFTGRGEEFPIALEGALKLKEIAYVHAEGYAAGELKHGPISLIDENMVNIAIVSPDLYEKTLSNAEEVKARRGIMVVIGQQGDTVLEEMSDFFVGLDYAGLSDTKPVLTNIVLQLLSYYIAKLKGTDIDKPRNLAKSVTVE